MMVLSLVFIAIMMDYPEYNGRMLRDHFDTADKVNKLIDGGDMSCTWTNAGWNNETLPESGPLHYTSRGESIEQNQPRLYKDLNEFLMLPMTITGQSIPITSQMQVGSVMMFARILTQPTMLWKSKSPKVLSTNIDIPMRIFGSALVIIAYFITIHIDLFTGVITHFIADLISIPYFIRTKSWDVVIMLSFLLVISLSKLLS